MEVIYLISLKKYFNHKNKIWQEVMNDICCSIYSFCSVNVKDLAGVEKMVVKIKKRI